MSNSGRGSARRLFVFEEVDPAAVPVPMGVGVRRDGMENGPDGGCDSEPTVIWPGAVVRRPGQGGCHGEQVR